MRIGIGTGVTRLRPAPSGGGGGGGGGGVTWNTANADSNIAFTNSDLTARATAGGGYRGAVATVGIANGEKKYFEIKCDLRGSNQALTIGVAATGRSYPLSIGGGNETYMQAFGLFTTNDIMCIAVDNTATRKIFFKKNAGGWTSIDGTGGADPTTGTGGTSIGGWTYPAIPMIYLYDNNDQVTARFSSGSWTYSAPTGFTAIS